MVVQSKQLRANSAMVHSGLSWDQVELKCCEECGKCQSPVRAVFVWNLMAVKHCLCMSTYPPTHTGVSCSQGVCTGKERQRNFYSTSGLTVPGWVRYTVKSDKVLHTVNKLSQKWSHPHMGLPAEPTTEAEHVPWPGQHQLRSWLWHEHCRTQPAEITG